MITEIQNSGKCVFVVQKCFTLSIKVTVSFLFPPLSPLRPVSVLEFFFFKKSSYCCCCDNFHFDEQTDDQYFWLYYVSRDVWLKATEPQSRCLLPRNRIRSAYLHSEPPRSTWLHWSFFKKKEEKKARLTHGRHLYQNFRQKVKECKQES